jgi:hypothetical protein
LFRALNPSQSTRLVLDLTASYKGDGENLLPPAAAIGATRESFPMTGRGSARVFSPPLTPQIINGEPYLAIDMGVDGQYFPEHRTGLMSLYGADYRVDSRRMTGFARDISLVSEDDYQHLAPPSAIRDFLVDLANPDLEYSGLYEDGAASESAFLGLTQPADDSMLVVKGVVPQTDDPDFTTEVRVLVDGHEVARQLLVTGRFEVWGAAPPGAGRRRVELHFSKIQHLPGDDQRPVAAIIQMVGFDGQAGEVPPAKISTLPDDLEQPGLWSAGLYDDGAASDSVFLGLTQPTDDSVFMVKGMVPLTDNPAFTTEARVLIDGHELARRVLVPGRFEIWGAAPSGVGHRRVELHFSNVQRLPDGDLRSAAAIIQVVGFDGQTDEVPPRQTVALPADLEQQGLWSIGMDPDGWMAGRSFVALAYPGQAADIVVRGAVPQLDDPSFKTELHVIVDGLEAASKTVGVGEFELRAPVPPGPPRRRVELRFSAVQPLLAPDTRQVGAHLTLVGFEAETNTMPPVKIDAFPTDLQNPALRYAGLDTDGWITKESFVELLQPDSPADLVVRVMVPMIGDAAYATDLQVLLDGQELARRTLGPGDFELRIPVQTAAGRRRVELRFSSDQQLPAPDNRQRAAKINGISFEASSADSPELAAPVSASAPSR